MQFDVIYGVHLSNDLCLLFAFAKPALENTTYSVRFANGTDVIAYAKHTVRTVFSNAGFLLVLDRVAIWRLPGGLLALLQTCWGCFCSNLCEVGQLHVKNRKINII